MQFYADISLAVTYLSLCFLVIGLYRPWVMLWWEDRQNRKKVIKVYGAAAILFYLLNIALTHFHALF
ncbi:MAG TPA: hypothetical protein PKL31_08080 [Fulvivirga sp.]|nr:hypothetical protein [Fulvivirga sp.]